MESTKKSHKVNRKINKHLQAWLCSLLLGKFGVDRFTRKQIGLGLLKFAVATAIPFVALVVCAANCDFTVDMTAQQVLDALEAYGKANLAPILVLTISAIIGNIWALVDFVIALVKAYGQAYGEEKMFTFDARGKYLK